MRVFTIILIAFAILLPAATPFAYDAVDPKVIDGPDFPRLAMWHPSFWSSPLEDCARYDVAVGNFQVPLYDDPTRGTFAQALRIRNPNIKLLTYFTNSVLRHSALYGGTRKSNPYMPDWPDKWYLTEAGSTLAAEVGRRQKVIKVSTWRMSGPSKGGKPNEWDIFRAGTETADRDVLVEGEIMSVIAVDPKTRTITVERGMNGTKARAHPAGVRIAPILRFWAGSYFFNLTDDCPTAELHGARGPELFSEYSFRMSRRKAADWFWFIDGDQDGFCFDLMADTISWVMWADARSIDLNHDNSPDPFDELDAKWKTGIDRVTALFRDTYPGKALVRNNCRDRRYEEYEGECFMSWPHNQWATWDYEGTDGLTKYWHRFFFGHEDEERGGIVEFVNRASLPNYTHVETCDLETDLDLLGHPELANPETIDRYHPNYQKMRWGITSALLAGVYYVYVVHTDGHGQLGLLWFDEFDNCMSGSRKGRGYLGQPISDVQKLVTSTKNKDWGAWGREFENGFVICNPLGEEATVPLPPGIWQRLRGTQAPKINNGAIEEGSVTVQAYDGLILRRFVEGYEEAAELEEYEEDTGGTRLPVDIG